MSRKLGYYDIGMTTQYACQSDQRFSYWMYVPKDYDTDGDTRYPLIIPVHGTHRRAMMYRDLFMDFAEKHKCIVLAPQFPAGIEEPGELANYKFLKYRDIRFDTLLLDMVAEITGKYRVHADKLMLFGFSGGAHFVHRFLYLHADKVLAASIGAPGMVTLLDDSRTWHCGVENMEEVFGQPVLWDALPSVAVQMIIGEEDTETWEITITPSSRFWMEGVNDAGRNRLERLASLRTSFEAHGIQVQHDSVPGVGHDGVPMIPKVQEFLLKVKQEAGL